MIPQTPNSASGDLFFEPLLRRFLAFQLQQLSKNIAAPGLTFFDELFGRFGDDTRLQIKKWFSENTNIETTINFPHGDVKLPMLCVINIDESENSSEAYLADYGGRMIIGQRSVTASGPNLYGQPAIDERPRALQTREVISIPENHTTRIYVATDDVNSTLYLYYAIKALIVMNKMDFDTYAGARNLKISGSDFEHKSELFPDFAYCRVINLSYDMNFDVPMAPVQTIGGVNLTLGSFLTTDQGV